MAIDPSIALGYRPPQINLDIPSPLQQMGQVMTLRGMMEQGQARQMQMEQMRLQMQDQERARQDDRILRQAYADAGGDLDKTGTLLMQRGGSPTALQTLQKQRDEHLKSLSEMDKNEFETRKYKHDQLYGLMNQMLALPDDQYVAQWPVAAQTARAIDPRLQLPDTPMPKDQLRTAALQFTTQDQLLKQAEEKRKADEAARTATKQNLENTQAQRTQDAIVLAAAMARGPQAFAAELAKLPPERQPLFAGATTPKEVLQRALTPEQFMTTTQAADTAAEIKRHNLSDESTAKIMAGIASGRLKQEQLVNGIKYGPGTSQFWVQQLFENPDSVKELPPELKSVVGQGFKAAYGLPLPTALSDSAKASETAARNALDGAAFIRQALQNPEIRSRIGPIMGRLGQAEQDVGATVGLSPQAAALAQELRTRMRYFVFQEGKAVLGGRMPQNLMQQLETSSANVKMEPDTLEGALRGAEGAAQSTIGNLDRQRFGGQSRTKTQPAPTAAPTNYQVGQTVMYNGAPHKIKEIKNGKLVLEQ